MALLADRATAPAATRAPTIPAALLALSIGAMFAVVAGLWRFTWPVADDFVRAVEGRDYGILGGVVIEYTTWSCRWAAGLVHFVLAALLPLTRAYGASLAAIALLSLLILSRFIAGVLELRWRSLATLFVVSAFAALWWAGSPSVSELFFWRAAAVEYQLGWSAAIALAYAACRLDFAPTPVRATAVAALALAAFFVSGLHELAAALETGLFAVVAVAARLSCGRWRPAASVAFGASLIGLALVIAAPGNGAREAAVGGSHALWRDAAAALWQAAQDGALWLADPKTLAAAAALVALRARGDIAPRWPERLPARARWALTGLPPAALAALYVVPAAALAGAVPARTLAGLHLVFLCGGLVVVSAWAPSAARWLARRRIDGDRMLRLALVALALALPASRNVVAGIADLRGPAESFHAFMAARDATLRRLHAAGIADANLPVIAKAGYPRSYVFHADIRADAEFWINRWWARYYGLAAVRALDPRPADRFR
ncbi:MAG: hypothetical protein KGL11_00020 [Alphaproteobacteria bacterium]|nr:hypothetical protein [Alphaproteobacteria bacterium]